MLRHMSLISLRVEENLKKPKKKQNQIVKKFNRILIDYVSIDAICVVKNSSFHKS